MRSVWISRHLPQNLTDLNVVYFTGKLMFMDRASAWAAVDIFGGHAAESFYDVDYAVVGARYNPEVCILTDYGAFHCIDAYDTRRLKQ